MEKLRKISDPQRGTKSKEVLVDSSLESFRSVPWWQQFLMGELKSFKLNTCLFFLGVDFYD